MIWAKKSSDPACSYTNTPQCWRSWSCGERGNKGTIPFPSQNLASHPRNILLLMKIYSTKKGMKEWKQATYAVIHASEQSIFSLCFECLYSNSVVATNVNNTTNYLKKIAHFGALLRSCLLPDPRHGDISAFRINQFPVPLFTHLNYNIITKNIIITITIERSRARMERIEKL